VLALVLERGELVLGEGDTGEVGRVARDEGGACEELSVLVLGEGDTGEVGRVARDEGGACEELGVLGEVVGGAEGLTFGDDLGFADALQKGGQVNPYSARRLTCSGLSAMFITKLFICLTCTTELAFSFSDMVVIVGSSLRVRWVGSSKKRRGGVPI
jgi:hypothetical protein